MEAAQLRQGDLDYRNHLQAFLNFAVQATKKDGKPVYSTFKKFYKTEKKKRDKNQEDRFARLSRFIKNQRKEE